MRLATVVDDLLSQELTSGEALQGVTVARIQAAPWDWVLFSFASTAEHAPTALLSTLMPFRPGELLLLVGNVTAFYSRQGVMPEAVPQDAQVVQQALVGSPKEVQFAIERARREDHGSLIFARIQRDKTLSDVDSLSRTIRESSWFAFKAVPPALRQRRVEIALGAQTGQLAVMSGSPISAAESRHAHVSFFLAPPSALVPFRILTPNGHTKTIRLTAARVASALGISPSTHYGFAIRLPLEVEIISLISGHGRADLLQAVQSCAGLLYGAREYCRKAIEHNIDETIRLLEARRQQTRSRQMVAVVQETGPPLVLGSVPTNEHEVLILTGKLEAHIGRVLPVFCVWEHTSQSGIDALADVQLSKDSAPMRRATLEFEFELGNFFRHSHPIRQTEFVVCWSNGNINNGIHYYGDGAVDRRGELTFEMRGRDWIRFLDFGDHLIRVLVLQNFPGLRIHNPNDSHQWGPESGLNG